MSAALSEQVALITGAGGAIGGATARVLAEARADIVVNDFGNPDGCEATRAAVEERGRLAVIEDVDVADLAAVTSMVERTVARFGRLDVLVNNAGITRDALLVKMSEAQWDQVLAVNLKGAFCCTKAATKPMMKQRSGSIVFISSVIGLMGNAGQANYGASKAGLLGLMRCTARELARRNVRANAICPGFIETPMTQALSEEVRAKLADPIPLARLGAPEDVAQAVLFLCSPAATYITGQVLNVDGGMVM